MDLEVMRASLPMFLEGFYTTLTLGGLGILIAIGLGFLSAVALYFKVPVLTPILKGYTEFARNTPLLIQLFFLYYGLPKIGLTLDKNVVAIIGLAFLGTAYMSEAFRSSFANVPQGQVEAGRALGFSRWQIAREIIFPQGLPLSISSVGANVIFLLKETSVFSGIAVLDLTNTARTLIGLYYRTYEYLFVLGIFYILMILPVIIVLNILERRWGLGRLKVNN
ncbi:polar amino acid ABC transporter permease [Suicoccus acidiformans]|uniref:Polar amino acid ABC transporter permease n=1 Tax=Suicoccus acidiformans TaxID=2036206 RepID=A0A347WKP3_9LACT|nr:amino acid ABC transporter permease [Suicoccus acidiformans]AXY25650.1 polar amino acid ABC transporter permease [Suicoccus acidiformans]